MRILRQFVASFLTSAFASAASGQTASSQPIVFEPLTQLLLNSPPQAVISELTEKLRAEPSDNTRFALGVARLLRGVERMGQSLHRFGFEPVRDLDILAMIGLPSPQIPVPRNDHPERASYDTVRQILQNFIDDLAAVDRTLEPIRDSDVRLALPIGLVRLDFDRDGTLAENERLWRLFARVMNVRDITAEQAQTFIIQLDRADVEWLRGYTHLIRGLLETVLAYDLRELFARTGQMFFVKTDSPYGFLERRSRKGDPEGFVDLIAFIHLLNFKLSEPARMRAAHEHLTTMIRHSRAMWKHILSENDDTGEWIPSPAQHSVVASIRFTPAMIDGWHEALSQMEDLLSGKKLVPFWRNDARGVNLRKVFLEPRDIDLVMWMQGTDAAPFLESGEKVTAETWQRFQTLFGGRFFTFAAWIN